MNILMVSQCSKNALTETRRILDQFAERRGERTWQTPITQQGLATLYRLLRKTARKNTAVACHWIRGRDHSELLWIVGDARRFNAQGATPTNTTERDVLRAGDENDWHTAEDIRLLARLAALFHDLGKANDGFQEKLTSTQAIADPYRHEWVSLRLFEAFVGQGCTSDRDWLERLLKLDGGETEAVLAALNKDGQGEFYSPFATLKFPLAQVTGWLIVSHHRLPVPEKGKEGRWEQKESLPEFLRAIAQDWCGSRPKDKKVDALYWQFSRGLSFNSRHWRDHVGKVADAILKRPGLSGDGAVTVLSSPYTLHLARLVLMLADHYYSAQPSHKCYGDYDGDRPLAGKALYANSGRNKEDVPVLNQCLDEHLIGVEVNAGRLMRALPRLEHSLPRIARHKGFRARSTGDFRWQNTAFDLAESVREKSAQYGFFGVNMASTGCGKTLANGRIVYGLADPRLGARFMVALGLRTLTLQTGDAYRERLHLGQEDLAVLVGGVAIRALHDHQQGRSADSAMGRESAVDLLPEQSYIRYESSLEDGPLKRWLYPDREASFRGRRGRQASALLDAPVLVCTVDHLVPATESTRGGHQILPMLRLMTSDLVLDELDDFGMEDLPALTRLVHWAGLLGSRVLLSSATLPPALVHGLFLAYCAGRKEFQKHRGKAGERLAVCCAWFDEFGAEQGEYGNDEGAAAFLSNHDAFVQRRITALAKAEAPRRRARIVDVPIKTPTVNDKARRRQEICSPLAVLLQSYALDLHRQFHTVDEATGKRVSFGLIRMANISPLFDVAHAWFGQEVAAGYRIHLCPYHSQHPLLVRFALEKELDASLKRHDEKAVFRHEEIARRLAGSEAEDHVFIVLATAVAEVGRDHDYDWAIVEPSSMRSIIQLAGRVRRHRKGGLPSGKTNILLMDVNVRYLQHGGGKLAFVRPGFEDADLRLRSHQLTEILTPEQWQVIDARPRIRPRTLLLPDQNLADLEHARLNNLMLGAQAGERQLAHPVRRWWETPVHLTGILQQLTLFRQGAIKDQVFVLMPTDEECSDFDFCRQEDGVWGSLVDQGNLFSRLPDGENLGEEGEVRPWAIPDYLTALQKLAEDLNMEPAECARRFGTIELLSDSEGSSTWWYHRYLGFSRRT